VVGIGWLGINTLLYLCDSSPTSDAFYTFNMYLTLIRARSVERFEGPAKYNTTQRTLPVGELHIYCRTGNAPVLYGPVGLLQFCTLFPCIQMRTVAACPLRRDRKPTVFQWIEGLYSSA